MSNDESDRPDTDDLIDSAAAFDPEAGVSFGSTLAHSTWKAPEPEMLAELFPEYEILELLGRGGMGAVYRGIQKSLDREVAIKLLPPEIAGIDPSFSVRFRREARAMAGLNHPNIVTVYDFGQTEGGHCFFAMEFVDGMDFHQLIRSGRLDPEGALNAVSQICSALEYAHARGYIHRDIKPANIFINGDGLVKVGDFGIAKIALDKREPSGQESGITVTGMAIGTPFYSAPEQMSGQPVDHRADIYSLGVVLYEMLTNELPRGCFLPPSRKVQIDIRLDRVVLKAMESERERRYSNAAEMRTDVDGIRTGGTRPPESEGGGGEGFTNVSRPGFRMTAWIVSILLGLGVLAWGWFVLLGDSFPAPNLYPARSTEKGGLPIEVPSFHGETRPIPGTAGWRSEQPGQVVAFPPMPESLENPPPWVEIPPGLDSVVALYSTMGVSGDSGQVAFFAIHHDGRVTAWGPELMPVLAHFPDDLENVVALSVCETFGLALLADGTVLIWGVRRGETLPDGAALSDVLDGIPKGARFRAVSGVRDGAIDLVTENGRLLSFDRDQDSRVSPPAASANMIGMVREYETLLGIDGEGALSSWSKLRSIECMMGWPPRKLPPVRVIAGGCCGILEDGSAFVWHGPRVSADDAYYDCSPRQFADGAELLAVGLERMLAAARLPGRQWKFFYYFKNRRGGGDAEFSARMALGCTQLRFVTPDGKVETGWWFGIRPPEKK